MNRASSLRLLLAVGLLSQASCTEDLIAPATSENLPVSVQTRAPSVGEVIPTVRVSGGMGYVAVSVTRSATGCATLVSAGVSRGTDVLAVVTHVGPNPAALCALNLSNQVVVYGGIINSVAAGTYRVRVFEGVLDGTPQLIGSATVSVALPGGQL